MSVRRWKILVYSQGSALKGKIADSVTYADGLRLSGGGVGGGVATAVGRLLEAGTRRDPRHLGGRALDLPLDEGPTEVLVHEGLGLDLVQAKRLRDVLR
jgi:hypothetical protein